MATPAVVWVDVPDLAITAEGVHIRFLLSDILLTRTMSVFPDRTVLVSYAAPVEGNSAIAVQGSDGIEAAALALGEPVSDRLTFVRTNGFMLRVTCPVEVGELCTASGPFASVERYLPLKYWDESGAYYGWARVGQAGGESLAILYDFAIETTPEMPILAGSSESLPVEVTRALRFAGGLETPTPNDVALLDRAGEPGRLDLMDAVALARLMTLLDR